MLISSKVQEFSIFTYHDPKSYTHRGLSLTSLVAHFCLSLSQYTIKRLGVFRGLARIFQRGSHTVSNIIVMAFSPRNIVGCLLKNGLQSGGHGHPRTPLATPLVLLLILDGMLVHRRLPPAIHQVSLTVCWYPFILLDGERHCESKASCPRTQHNDPARARTRTFRSGVQRAKHKITASPTELIEHSDKFLSKRGEKFTRCHPVLRHKESY